jgi:hypothetical protein
MNLFVRRSSVAAALAVGSLTLTSSGRGGPGIQAQGTVTAPPAGQPGAVGGRAGGGAIDPKLYAPIPTETTMATKAFPDPPADAAAARGRVQGGPPAVAPGAPTAGTPAGRAGGGGGGASYPRVIQIKQYAPMKGQLLATFVRGGFPIYRSTDNGDSWEFVTFVQGLRGQPALYELPRKMGEFPAGTIMASGLSSNPPPGRSALDVHYSSDGGQTWTFLSTIVEGNPSPYDPGQRSFVTKGTPVWEPYLYHDVRGRLVAFYSDERHKKDGYNQLLAHRVSNDGGRTWGPEVFDVAIPDGLVRAGMSVVTQNTNNGKFFMSYEMVGLPGYQIEPRSNPVHFRVSTDGDRFGDPKDRGTLIQDRWRQFLWATPTIVWSPWPAQTGTLIASGRATMRFLEGQVGNGLMINRNNGEGLWTLIETPIRYTPPDGYSQTMIPLGDGREILQLLGADGQMKYAKFKLPEKLPEYEFPFGPKKP